MTVEEQQTDPLLPPRYCGIVLSYALDGKHFLSSGERDGRSGNGFLFDMGDKGLLRRPSWAYF